MTYYQPVPVTFVSAAPGSYYNATPVVLVDSTGHTVDLSGAGSSAVQAVNYAGDVNAARPTATAVYWIGFPSTPTNAQSQDIVVAAASPRIIQEYSGATNLSSQAFPTSGGKAPTSLTIDVMIAPGAGGGSGRRGAAGTIRCGGGGGGSGGVARSIYIPATQFGNGWSLSIPAAGAGGAAVTTDNTDGVAGSGANANMIFQTQFVLVMANAGDSGKGGTATSGAGSNYGGSSLSATGSYGTSASTTGGPGVQTSYFGTQAPAGGSSGGGITSANIPGNGADGGNLPYAAGSGIGSGGVVDGAVPTSGIAQPGWPGSGAGSGAASITRAAQAGAAATGYGAGGSGGGASLNGFASGAGGAGGPGFIRLIWDYS